jgi:exopolysaccharide production protein ExoZ
MDAPASQPHGLLRNLHALRVIAALSVVYFHITSEAGLDLPVNIGSHGVDLFFVISGFIISYIGSRSPERFLLRRLIRIVPFYWTATLVVFAAASIAPHLFHSTRPDYLQLLCSLSFVPRQTDYAGLFPTLILGWSLNYEMYFYLVFAAALLLSRRLAPLLCCLGIGAVVALVHLSGTSQPSLLFYGRTLVFEFVLGIAAYYTFMAVQRNTACLSQLPGLRVVLWCVVLGSLGFLGIEEYQHEFGLPRFLAAGLPASTLVIAALLLERVYGISAKSKSVFLAGESSYILYLIHPYIIYTGIRVLFPHHHELGPAGLLALIVALMLVALLVSIAIHVRFERPLLRVLHRRFLRPRAGGPAGVGDPVAA